MEDPLRAHKAITLAGALLIFCSVAGAADKEQPLAAGSWGGDHIGMEVTESGAKLDYDCAHGSIDQPIRLDGNGRFDLCGTHVRESPGPTRPGDLRSEAARFTGAVDGGTMTLTVKRADSGEEIGSYTLALGRLPRVRKCG